jgi:hypothetical protein
MVNLDNCERSYQAISLMIHRSGVDDSRSPKENRSWESDIEMSLPPITFDHSRCADCSYGYSITCDCTNHLAALQQQALDANQRLQALVEMREKMCEVAEEFLANTRESFSSALGLTASSGESANTK